MRSNMIKKKAKQSVSSPAEAQDIVKEAVKEGLDYAAQKICPGFFPNRIVQPDRDITEQQRLELARILKKQYDEADISPPPALLILL